jgi:hypothetical protein
MPSSSSARRLDSRPVVSDEDILAAFARAPIDDRPETEEERAAVEAAKAQASGGLVPHAAVVASVERWRTAG